MVGGVCMSYISCVCDEPVGQCLALMLLDATVYFFNEFFVCISIKHRNNKSTVS